MFLHHRHAPVLAQAPEEAEARRARAIAAIMSDDFEGALRTTAGGGGEEGEDVERAYALYKLNRSEEALALLAASPGPGATAALHVRAQALFKLGRYGEAAEALAAVAEAAGAAAGDDVELMTNVYAAFVAAGRGGEALRRFPVGAAAMEAMYELAFVTGAALIDAEEWEAAEARLKEAQGACIDRGGVRGLLGGGGGCLTCAIDQMQHANYSHLQAARGGGGAGCGGAAQRGGGHPPRGT